MTLTRDPSPVLRRLTYDTSTFNFSLRVARMLGVHDLTSLEPPPDLKLLTRETDQSPPDYQRFYSQFWRLRRLYERLVEEVVAPFIGEPYCYQAVPTLRIHYRKNVAVGEFHKDSDYNHPDGEINFWVPLTPAWASNSLWVEHQPGSAKPVQARPGEIVVFDAVNVGHGNKVNRTRSTRVSFDFRCLPLSQYKSTDLRSVNSHLPFRVGGYYRLPTVH